MKKPQAQFKGVAIRGVPLAEKGLFSYVQCNDRAYALGPEWLSKSTPLISQLEREKYLFGGVMGMGKVK